MKKIIIIFLSMAVISGCKNADNKGDDAPLTIKNDKLSGFLLAGIYFFNGYGGTKTVYDMIKPNITHEINSKDFLNEMETSYTEYMIFPFGTELESNSKETLKEFWGIENKSNFMETLDYLKKSGHQDEFAIYKKMIDDNGGASADLTVIEAYKKDDEVKQKLAFIKSNYDAISTTGIKAWDYARYVNNVCLGYSAGYVTKLEGEKLIDDLLKETRNSYKNWNDYYKDYMMGLKYWGGDKENETQYENTIKEMLEGEYSIYKYLPLAQ